MCQPHQNRHMWVLFTQGSTDVAASLQLSGVKNIAQGHHDTKVQQYFFCLEIKMGFITQFL